MFYLNATEPSHVGGPSPHSNGWIYLAYDRRHLNQTKVGLTRRTLWDRMRETTNPFYTLFAAFHVPMDQHLEIKRIENYLQQRLGAYAIPYAKTGRKSEYFSLAPDVALRTIMEKFPNVVPIPTNGDFEYDYTAHCYFAIVNPYECYLSGSVELDEYIRFAAPDIYVEELATGLRLPWAKRPNFLQELKVMNCRAVYHVGGPEILIRRLNYDLARIGYPNLDRDYLNC